MSSVLGLVAEFADPEALLKAARNAHSEGYRMMEAYSPFPIEGLHEALGKRPTRLPRLVLGAGAFGAVAGWFLQWYPAVIDYPMNIGGRPLASWPTYIPIIFELTILCAASTAFLGVFVLNRLPRLHHPIFEVPGFDRATNDRFFLCLEASDPRFKTSQTRQLLETFGAVRVTEVVD